MRNRNIVIWLVTLVAIGAMPAAALDGPGRALVASNQLRIETKPIITTGARAFIPPYAGTVRVKLQIRSIEGVEVSARANVLHLDSCETAATTSNTFVNVQCTLRVAGGLPVVIVPNDGAAIRNVGLYYDVVDFDGKSIRFEVETVM